MRKDETIKTSDLSQLKTQNDCRCTLRATQNSKLKTQNYKNSKLKTQGLKTTILLLLLTLIGLTFACQSNRKKEIRYVAYVGFHTVDTTKAARRQFTDPINVRFMDQYLARLSKEFGGSVQFEKKVFDCNFDEQKIDSIYQLIEQDPKIILVIDNTWGKHILRARERIQSKGIPVISLVADQNGLDFGHNAVFLSPSDPQPFFMIRYISEVLKVKSVCLISETDYKLHNRFVQLLDTNHIACNLLVPLSQNAYDSTNNISKAKVTELRKMLTERLPTCADSVILLNLHGGYAKEVLRFLQEHPLHGKAIVGLQEAAQLSPAAMDSVTRLGCIFITLSNDDEAMPLEVYTDWQQFTQNDTAFFGRNAAPHALLQRMWDATNLLRQALQQSKQADRAGIAAYFRSLGGQKLATGNELYEFDRNLILLKSRLFSQLKAGKLRTCPTQINSKGDSMANLRVGIDIIDISDIDLKSNTFNCNLRYWVIADSQHIDKESFINFNTLIRADDSQITRISERHEGEYVIRMYQVSGKFFNDYQTFDFPVDRQDIIVPVTALASSDELKINFDDSRLQRDEKLPKFIFNDWNAADFFVTNENQISSRLGGMERVNATAITQDLEKYKVFNVHLVVDRKSWGAITLIILPFLMFSMLPIFMLFSRNITFRDVGEPIMSTFLAAVAYSINLVQLSPTTDSLNRAYLYLLLSLAINSACLLFVVFIDRQKTKGGLKDENKQALKWFPFFLMGLFMFCFYLIFS